MKDKIIDLAQEFSGETHGSSNYDQEKIYLQGRAKEFVPFGHAQKKFPELLSVENLLKEGFVFSSYNYLEFVHFDEWYEKQFSKKLSSRLAKQLLFLTYPDHLSIFEAVELANKTYNLLREKNVILNGKNLPVQLGEWYAKCIFGLKQVRSSSQRGFDFYLESGPKVEVKVHWSDTSSPKGVKIKKSLIELSDFCLFVYMASNFTIRDILFLDSHFLLRKFDTKGHTLFLKDGEISSYFFSKSSKHYDKVVNRNALMKFSSPQFVMKLGDLHGD